MALAIQMNTKAGTDKPAEASGHQDAHDSPVLTRTREPLQPLQDSISSWSRFIHAVPETLVPVGP